MDIITTILSIFLVIAFIYAICLIYIIGIRFLILLLALCVALFLCGISAYLLVRFFNAIIPSSTQIFIFGDHYQTFSERIIFGIILVSLIALFFILKKYRWKKDRSLILYGILSILLINIPMIFLIHSDSQDLFENDATFFENNTTNMITLLLWNYIAWINLCNFVFYTFDKVVAILAGFLKENFSCNFFVPRIPEKILHLYTICSGIFGASIAMYFFDHKVTSEKFQPVYRKIVFAYVVCTIILLVANFIIFLSNN